MNNSNNIKITTCYKYNLGVQCNNVKNIWNLFYTAVSSSSDDSDEGTDEEIKSEESDIEERTEMVCLLLSPWL